jgi:uncharacterized protein (UPF0333 family)
MYKKRGQAALEFLMTYGWAILSAIIVIGALGSYFYFNNAESSTIFVSQPFYGVASNAVASTGIVNLEIQNKGAEDINTVTVNITEWSNGVCTQDVATFVGTDKTAQVIPIACTGLTAGDSFKGDIIVTYRRPGSSIDLSSTGSVSTPISA